MFQPPNYVWKCKKCGKEVFSYEDVMSLSMNPKCPDCGGEMEGVFIVKGGPDHDNHPLKHY